MKYIQTEEATSSSSSPASSSSKESAIHALQSMNPIKIHKLLSRFGADIEICDEIKSGNNYHYFAFKYDNEIAVRQAFARMRLDGIEAHPAIQSETGACAFF